MKEQFPNLADQVMGQIKRRNIKMRPGIYFIIQSLLLKSILGLVILLTIFLVNLTIFKFRVYLPFEFLKFGLLGIKAFLGSIPWIILINTVFLITIAIYLFKQFDISYKRGFSTYALGMMFVLIFGGMLVDQTGINDNFKKQGILPLLYFGQYTSDYWAMGEITGIDKNNNTFTIITPVNEQIIISRDQETIIPKESFQINQYIKAVGKKQGNIFKASGIIFSNISDLK